MKLILQEKTCFKVRGGAVRIRVNQAGGGGGGGGRLLDSQGPSWAGLGVGPAGMVVVALLWWLELLLGEGRKP